MVDPLFGLALADAYSQNPDSRFKMFNRPEPSEETKKNAKRILSLWEDHEKDAHTLSHSISQTKAPVHAVDESIQSLKKYIPPGIVMLFHRFVGPVEKAFLINEVYETLERYVHCRGQGKGRTMCSVGAGMFFATTMSSVALGTACMRSAYLLVANPLVAASFFLGGAYMIGYSSDIGDFVFKSIIDPPFSRVPDETRRLSPASYRYDIEAGPDMDYVEFLRDSDAESSAPKVYEVTDEEEGGDKLVRGVPEHSPAPVYELVDDEEPGENEMEVEFAETFTRFERLQPVVREKLAVFQQTRSPTDWQQTKTALDTLTGVANGLSGIANIMGRPRVACQITAVSSGIVTATNLCASLASGTINPVLGVGSLVGVIGGIVGAFGEERDTSGALMKSIAGLAQQVSELRDDMFRQFERLEDSLRMQDRLALSYFSALSEDIGSVHHKLERLCEKMEHGFVGTKALLRSISGKIDDFRNAFVARDVQDAVEEIGVHVYDALKYSDVQPEQFVQRAKYFETLAAFRLSEPKYAAVDRGPAREESVEAQIKSDHFSVNVFVERLRTFFPERDIDVPDLVNPKLYVAAVYALVFITLTQYPDRDCRDLPKRITRNDTVRLAAVKEKGDAVRAFTELLTSPVDGRFDMLEALADAYTENAHQAFAAFREFHAAELAEHLQSLQTDALTEHAASYYDPLSVSRFTRQFDGGVLSVRADYGNWHKTCPGALTVQVRNVTRGMFIFTEEKTLRDTFALDERAIAVKSNEYKTTMINQIKNQVNAALLAMETCRVDNDIVPVFVVPEDNRLPVLFLHRDLYDRIAGVPEYEDVFCAIRHNCGRLEVRYRIEPEANGWKTVVLSYFYVDKKARLAKTLIGNDVFRYEPTFYAESEEIWWMWMGGRFAVSPVGRTIRYENAFGASDVTSLTHTMFVPDLPADPYAPTEHMVFDGHRVVNGNIQRAFHRDMDVLITQRLIATIETDQRLGEYVKRSEYLCDTFQLYTSFAFPDNAFELAPLFRRDGCLVAKHICPLQRRDLTIDEFADLFTAGENRLEQDARLSYDWRPGDNNLDTALTLLENVIDYYRGYEEEYNYWYSDETQKIAVRAAHIDLLLKMIAYMEPANAETFIYKEFVPMIESFSPMERQVEINQYILPALENHPEVSSRFKIEDVLRHAIAPN